MTTNCQRCQTSPAELTLADNHGWQVNSCVPCIRERGGVSVYVWPVNGVSRFDISDEARAIVERVQWSR
jgi:sulfur relay (sulfurtransferase) complex TusBCD TusD component (DsrE family)